MEQEEQTFGSEEQSRQLESVHDSQYRVEELAKELEGQVASHSEVAG